MPARCATTSLVPGETAEEQFERIVAGLSVFAGRTLEMDEEVYESEAATNFRNRGIAHLLYGYGRMYCDPEVATDVYTRQCALRVSARDLAVMGATLADGGVNPMTRERAVATGCSRRVLAVLATSGLYERSGDWLYDVGPTREERGQRGAGHGVPGQGRRGDLVPTPRRGGQQRARPTHHEVPLGRAGAQSVRLGPPGLDDGLRGGLPGRSRTRPRHRRAMDPTTARLAVIADGPGDLGPGEGGSDDADSLWDQERTEATLHEPCTWSKRERVTVFDRARP